MPPSRPIKIEVPYSMSQQEKQPGNFNILYELYMALPPQCYAPANLRLQYK